MGRCGLEPPCYYIAKLALDVGFDSLRSRIDAEFLVGDGIFLNSRIKLLMLSKTTLSLYN